MSEYLEEYKRGDFLVRNIIGADPKSGAVAINAVPRVGQTLQYQLRDSRVATDELKRLLREQIAPIWIRPPFAGLLCTCHGRGRGLFGGPNHDAGLDQRILSRACPWPDFSPMCSSARWATVALRMAIRPRSRCLGRLLTRRLTQVIALMTSAHW